MLRDPERADTDTDDEIRHFLDESAADLQARGFTADEARREARRWGHPAAIREQVRGAGWEQVVAMTAADLRQGARQLWRAPGAAVVAAITLALGVGANTAVLSVFESILVNPLPYHDAGRLISVTESDGSGAISRITAMAAHQAALRCPSLSSIGLYTDGVWVLAGNGDADLFRGQRVTGGFFETLGVVPMLGRVITNDDDRSDAQVVVLSYELWMARFGGDAGVVGRTYTLNGTPYRVIGVLGKDFQPFRMTNAAETPRIYGVFGFNPADPQACHNGCSSPQVVARLADGASIGQARTELAAALRALRDEHPAAYPRAIEWRAEPLQQQLTAALAPALWVAIAAAACVLLIACANLANLQLSRAWARTGEFAVRGALGASRGRLIHQMLLESLLIAAAGCAGGLLLGRAGLTLLLALAPRELPRLGEIALDTRVLLVAIAAGVATAIAAGVAPAWLAARTDLNDTLKRHADRRAGGSAARATLVVAQVALAFVLVTAAGLLVQTVRGLLAVDAGFDAGQVITMSPVFGSSRRMTALEQLTQKQQTVDAVEGLSGVTAAGLVNDVPLSHAAPFDYEIDGVPSDPAAQTDVFWVEGHYLEAMRMRLREGRLLKRSDDTGAPVAVVSETMARRFPDGRAIGRRVRLGDDDSWLTVVGVIGDVRNAGLDAPADAAIYVPLGMNPGHYVRLVARTTGNPAALERPIREVVKRIDPLVPVFHVQPMEDYVTSSMAQRRFALALVSAFGGLALALACIGLYGVLSYTVVLRMGELGVRAALGATTGNLLRLVLGHGAALVGAGLAAGILLAALSMRILSSLLFGVTSGDTVAFATGAIVVATAGLLACAVPARRAARVDPLSIMRA